jgi:diguanylate cyclase (GGDEF)-like protein
MSQPTRTPAGLPARAVLAALLLFALPAQADHRDVRIGVQIEGTATAGDPGSEVERWRPVTWHLNRLLNDHQFELIPMPRQAALGMADRGDLDFVITDPALYVDLEVEHGATRIATRITRHQDQDINQLAATLFTRSEQIDFTHFSDLAGRRLAALDAHSFAGWLVAKDVLLAEGIEASELELTFAGNDPWAVVNAVLDGRADVGVLPTGMLEQLTAYESLPRERLKVLEPRHAAFYPLAHSTSLYPEWALAKLRHTPDRLARQVVVALLATPPGVEYTHAAIEWTTPADYQPVHELLRRIGAPPYAGFGRLTLASALESNRKWLTLGVVLLTTLLLGSLYTLQLNRRLSQSETRLREENQERRQAEESLNRYGNELEERIRSRTAELEYLAHYDDLTGLPNRNLLFDRLDQTIAKAQQDSGTFALLMIGLDRIREINNTLGHYFGDMILQQAADLLVKALPDAAMVARSGDDTFVVLIAPCELPHAEEVAHQIHDLLDRTFYLDGHPLHMKAQIGLTLFPEHGIDSDTLMRHADVALHSVRRTRMEYALYDSNLNRHGLRDLKLLGDLRSALNSEDQLMLHYQPKVCLKQRRLIGVECLLRWKHPQMGLVSPELFIPLAERTGLIRPLTLWVMNAAFSQVSRWQEVGLNIVSAINLSAWNLQDRHLIGQVRELIEAWGVRTELLEMEVTESAMMNDPESVLQLLDELHDLGIRLSIDDFGTGYSSMSYLKRLPVDEVKIDKSFVLNIDENADDRAIVKATIDLAHSLGLEVIAEGVDSQNAVDILVELGCDTAQGFFIGRPQSSLDLLKWHIESPWGQALFRHHDQQPIAPIVPDTSGAVKNGRKSIH